MAEDSNSWELKTINKMLESTIKEQRSKRRWGVFFKLIVLTYVLALTFFFFAQKKDLYATVSQKPFTAMVTLNGVITADGDASADSINPLIEKAFKHPLSKGVIIKINSPGGSPVQSNLIYKHILKMRARFPMKKVYAVIEDVGASGAYWISCAADEIYADKSSIVGSIGAVMGSFGFVDAMEKYGIKRRIFVSGDNKALMDPFSPQTPEQEVLLQNEINLLLGLFTDVVKEGRGDRLKVTPDMFSGRFWLGVQAVDLGLIDGFGDASSVAQEKIKESLIIEYAPRKSLFGQLSKSLSQGITAMFTDISLNF